MKNRTIAFGVALLALQICTVTIPIKAVGQPAVTPEANRILKAMSDFIATQNQLVVKGQTTDETLLDSGQKLMSVDQVQVAIRRPDRLYASRKGMVRDQEMFYDGKQFTLLGKSAKFYATAPVPPAIDEALDYATQVLGLSAPGQDLFHSDVYAGLMEEVLSGEYIGITQISGRRCHHLAFRSVDVDWQIWIEYGERPLPRKYVITSKWLTAAPQYTVTVESWDSEVQLSDEQFQFDPPQGVSRIDFIRQGQIASGN